jgi:hypothetical protein
MVGSIKQPLPQQLSLVEKREKLAWIGWLQTATR